MSSADIAGLKICCYFYNDFTIKASLLNLHIISDRYLFRFLVYVYYIEMRSPWI
ncbi:MAG: hypothetical protein RM338_12515 [Nostoc sp. DedQUE12a]|nr:hypothetical protein [Nostoc sp. DedQUE12a]